VRLVAVSLDEKEETTAFWLETIEGTTPLWLEVAEEVPKL